MYFVQFLKDLDINATSEIKHDVGKTLFSVMPNNDDVALKNIKEALAIYLQIPSYPDIESQFYQNTDIAVKQLAANVYHLKSQLMLTNATLEASNAAIEALQLSNFRLSEAIKIRSEKTNECEGILGGIVKVKSVEFKGVSINLAEILRRLKRKIGGRA